MAICPDWIPIRQSPHRPCQVAVTLKAARIPKRVTLPATAMNLPVKSPLVKNPLTIPAVTKTNRLATRMIPAKEVHRTMANPPLPAGACPPGD